MASPQSYNPTIIGFVEGKGFLSIPLQTARSEYGELPSEYGLVPHAPNRRAKKALNLPLGLTLLRLLRERPNLAESLARFSERWGRDFRADFGVDMAPFYQRNDPLLLERIVDRHAAAWEACLEVELPDTLAREGLVSRATLNSIPPEALLGRAMTILGKKLRNPAHRADGERLQATLELLGVRQLLGELATITGGDLTRFGTARLAIHADEIARLLWRMTRYMPLEDAEELACVRGDGVEFEFAPRDAAFIGLGQAVGDCTADKAVRQVDRDVENIYWTVFTWFLDRNYQILKVYVDGQFVMKVHLLPLLVATRDGSEVVLTVDAIETIVGFREDTPAARPELLERKDAIFTLVVDEVRRIADAMGVGQVLAERFSNTAWVRRALEQLPEIYFHVEDLRKIDELEDVFELARRLSAAAGQEQVRSVFMELQVQNTLLQRGMTTVKGAKAFALLAGDPRAGIPLKRVSGI
jgi:hypothetical protein